MATPAAAPPTLPDDVAQAPTLAARGANVVMLLLGDGLLVATVVVAVIFSIVQWTSRNAIIGIDGYYHIKMAWLMRQQGLGVLFPLYFPWLPTTILSPSEFTDHHLLFHLMLVPFTFGDLVTGAKIAAVIFASAALLVMYQLMVESRVRMPLVWLLIAMAAAGPMLYRLSMTRRQSLTLLLLMLTLLVAFRGRSRWLLPIGFLFTWLFDGFPLLLGVCGAVFLGYWWERRRPDWSLLLYPAAGIILGNIIHPYFPNNILFSYLHMLPKVFQLVGLIQGDAEIQVGNEWYPYSLDFMFQSSWPALIMVPLGFVPILLDVRPSQLRRVDGRVIALGIIAVTFLILYARSRRWVEAEPAFATLFCAVSWSRALPARVTEPLSKLANARREWALAAVAVILIAPRLYTAVDDARDDVISTRDSSRYQAAATWLATNTPLGARVFATDWDDFPELFFWDTHNVYLNGLDPTYMYLENGPLYLQWRSITRGRVEMPGASIRDQFDCGWVFTDTDHGPFLRNAAADPDLVEVYRDKNAVIFAVRGWQPHP